MGVLVDTKFHVLFLLSPFIRVLVGGATARCRVPATAATAAAVYQTMIITFLPLLLLFSFYERVHILLAHDVTTALVKVSSCGLLLLLLFFFFSSSSSSAVHNSRGQSGGGSAARCLPARIDVVVVAPLLPFNIIIIPVSAYSSLFSFFLFV